ncbi:hypothetical protein EV426DRAFT_623890 [Tirmania nivea]|nr:hypothetical protein EV426DRAFT_623890 [Tirmania nivea]
MEGSSGSEVWKTSRGLRVFLLCCAVTAMPRVRPPKRRMFLICIFLLASDTARNWTDVCEGMTDYLWCSCFYGDCCC